MEDDPTARVLALVVEHSIWLARMGAQTHARLQARMMVAEGVPDPQIGQPDDLRCCLRTPGGALCPYALGHAGPCYQTFGSTHSEPTLTLSRHEGGTGPGWAATRQLLRTPSILIEPEITGYGTAATYKHW